MPERTFSLEIVTPERAVLNREVTSLVVPGVEGYLGVLAGHAPLLTELRAGTVRARTPDGRQVQMAIGGGFMDVSFNHVVILADSAEEATAPPAVPSAP
ncbi:MAG: ATP synthase F1 subunit epsilon [Armatimonadota bacterium]|nr:ATP synthase F1 subunit epsilon [Armatimonadota bacterium]